MIFYVNLAQVSRMLATVWEQSHPTFVDIELLQFPLVLPQIQRKAILITIGKTYLLHIISYKTFKYGKVGEH